MGFVFDGVEKIISLTPGTTSFDVQDMYSRWKDWIQLSDNSKFVPAFGNSVGGESLGGGQFVGGYFFLQNGWLIKPQAADHTLTVNGNLFPVPDSAPLFKKTDDDNQVNIVLRVSSLTQGITVDGSASNDVWNTAEKDYVLNSLATLLNNPTTTSATRIIVKELVGQLVKEDVKGELKEPNLVGNISKQDLSGELEDESTSNSVSNSGLRGRIRKS